MQAQKEGFGSGLIEVDPIGKMIARRFIQGGIPDRFTGRGSKGIMPHVEIGQMPAVGRKVWGDNHSDSNPFLPGVASQAT